MIKERWCWTRKSKKKGKRESIDAVAVERCSLFAGLAPAASRYAIAAWKKTCGD
jgi:hypothetical protein